MGLTLRHFFQREVKTVYVRSQQHDSGQQIQQDDAENTQQEYNGHIDHDQRPIIPPSQHHAQQHNHQMNGLTIPTTCIFVVGILAGSGFLALPKSLDDTGICTITSLASLSGKSFSVLPLFSLGSAQQAHDVVLTSMRRCHVASTSVRRHSRLFAHWAASKGKKLVLCPTGILFYE